MDSIKNSDDFTNPKKRKGKKKKLKRKDSIALDKKRSQSIRVNTKLRKDTDDSEGLTSAGQHSPKKMSRFKRYDKKKNTLDYSSLKRTKKIHSAGLQGGCGRARMMKLKKSNFSKTCENDKLEVDSSDDESEDDDGYGDNDYDYDNDEERKVCE